MQAAQMESVEEPPSMLWGLDPIFSTFAKLYVRDILQMTESIQVPDVYFYNSHPIFQVDVLGTVVYKRERDSFFCYGVDDGTGVINCLCWKKDLLKEKGDPTKSGAKHSDGAQGSFDPVAELEKLRQAQKNRCHLDIGDLLRVRGPVKTYRQQREITAHVYYKVNDPVMAVQIAWMMEVPQLYRQCYDKPILQQPDEMGDSSFTLLSKATNVIKDFVKQKMASKVRPYDVMDLLHPLFPVHSQTASEDQRPVAGPSSFQRLRQLVQETLQVLQDEGILYRKVRSQDEVYHVTAEDTDLLIAVKDIIREDSKREHFAEKGCHVLHILTAVRHSYSLNVTKAALEVILRKLECNSEIVSTRDNYYTAF
ncbi:CST complex subunit STN1 isoform X1 [Xyrichtys novacula]|uniref:CST complex subunit STN1 n=1 Tax=Xyrichtys novacula TaxID=13765 RepID=A0AAV1EW01_XYRNO|nr:CST complex subunit STN1 isoform X1 [Xyrichtys novacula]